METIKSLDLIISFDDTGSMSSVRKLVRQNVNQLLQKLFDEVPNLRVGLIVHNDYCDYPQHIFTLDFASDLHTLVNFVNRNSPCGGGDSPECYELALNEATKMSWKSDNRIFIMIGDEVPHGVGYRYNSIENKLDWKVECENLRDMNVKIYGVQALGRKNATYFYDGISRITGGIKLDLTQFQHIVAYINAVVYSQTGQLDSYQDTDTSFSTNLSLKNMFNKLRGGVDVVSAEAFTTLSKFQVMEVHESEEISKFVERNGCTFRRGKGYYQMVTHADGKANSEIIQANKEVLFVDKETGEVNSDTYWCRQQMGIPYGTKGTFRPNSHLDLMRKYDIFVQSNSYNRKLDKNTKFLYELEYA